MKKYIVRLSAEERETLTKLLTSGRGPARMFTRARILSKADQSDKGPGWDDEINVSNPEPWFNDGIELFFDGDNSKNDLSEYPDKWPFAYDSNDDQLRFIFDQNPTSTYSHIDVSAFDVSYLQNKKGYNIEASLPFDALLFTPTSGHVFGFEIAVMDNDLGVRQNCLRWWSNEDGEITWKDPSLFGTAILFD